MACLACSELERVLDKKRAHCGKGTRPKIGLSRYASFTLATFAKTKLSWSLNRSQK